MLSNSDLIKHLKTQIPRKIVKGEEKIIIGYSGGPDSRFLLEILFKIIKNPEKNIIVCHLNYKIRNSESDLDQKLVDKTCKNMNLIIEKFTCDLSKEKKGIQEKARDLRFEVFFKLSEKYSTKYIFLGHNLDDHVETILLNLIRGTNIKGLYGIKNKSTIKSSDKKIEIIRPLLNLKKHDISKYCEENNLKFRIDSSNNSNNYSRNLIRNNVIPEFKKINPKVLDSIDSLSKVIKNNSTEKILDFGEFSGLSLALAKKIIIERLILDSNKNIFLNKNHHLMIENVLLGKSKSENLPDDIIFYENKGEFLLKKVLKNQKKEIINIKVKVPSKINLPTGEILKLKIVNNTQNIKKNNQKKIYINEKYLEQNLFIRNRKEGDKISQLDTQIKTRVKKILSNHKNKQEKENVLIFSTDSEIIWILGIRQSIDSYVNKHDKKAIELTILKNSIQPRRNIKA
ncbi:MAG: tRNA lysidine(34) synthetase TilS [Dehalococcoidales bacterium]|jgi:tRNA(Ile)-lysidine synthase|nr:tRNA lysidine(34) synthetase TilS [Dehalococcoidales bacterium]